MDKKVQEIRTAHAKMENADLDWGLSILRDHIGFLLQQIEIKDKALEFYEDTSTYTETMEEIQNVFSPKGMPSYRTNSAPIVFDKGERARAALKGEE